MNCVPPNLGVAVLNSTSGSALATASFLQVLEEAAALRTSGTLNAIAPAWGVALLAGQREISPCDGCLCRATQVYHRGHKKMEGHAAVKKDDDVGWRVASSSGP